MVARSTPRFQIAITNNHLNGKFRFLLELDLVPFENLF